jgi:hypothetical protein
VAATSTIAVTITAACIPRKARKRAATADRSG